MSEFLGEDANLAGFVFLPLNETAAGLPREREPGDPRSMSIRLVWAFIVFRGERRTDGFCELKGSARTIAQDAGLDRQATTASLAYLERHGFVKILGSRKGASKIIMRRDLSLTWPEEAAPSVAGKPAKGGRETCHDDRDGVAGKPATTWQGNRPRVAGKPAKGGRETCHHKEEEQEQKERPPLPSPHPDDWKARFRARARAELSEGRSTCSTGSSVGSADAEHGPDDGATNPPPATTTPDASRWRPDRSSPRPARSPDHPDLAPASPRSALGALAAGSLHDVTPPRRPRWQD